MKIAAIQFCSELGNVEKNYGIAEKYMKEAVEKGAELLVLPEMWNTGFYPENVHTLADINGQRTQQFLAAFAEQFHVSIVGGSVACRRQDGLYNTTYIVNTKGDTIASYDKVHLFTPGKEDAVFTPGKTPNVFVLDDVSMGSIICYDLRFAEWVRTAALAGAQILFVPAAWPLPRLRHWQILNTARAIENQCFVVAVNACGITGDYHFAGHSMIIDPLGNIFAEAEENDDCIIADIDVSHLSDIRRSINVFADRRPDLYEAVLRR